MTSISTKRYLVIAAGLVLVLLASCAAPMALQGVPITVAINSKAPQDSGIEYTIAYKLVSADEIAKTQKLFADFDGSVTWHPDTGWADSNSQTSYPSPFFEEGTYLSKEVRLSPGQLDTTIELPNVPVGQYVRLMVHFFNNDTAGQINIGDQYEWEESQYDGPTTFKVGYGFPDLPQDVIDFAIAHTLPLFHNASIVVGYTDPFKVLPGETVDVNLRYFVVSEVDQSALSYNIYWSDSVQ